MPNPQPVIHGNSDPNPGHEELAWLHKCLAAKEEAEKKKSVVLAEKLEVVRNELAEIDDTFFAGGKKAGDANTGSEDTVGGVKDKTKKVAKNEEEDEDFVVVEHDDKEVLEFGVVALSEHGARDDVSLSMSASTKQNKAE